MLRRLPRRPRLQAPADIDGRSFLPLLTGAGNFALRPYQVWYSPDRRQAAVLEGRWRAVWMRDTLGLFDIVKDPAERDDLAQREPVVAAHMDSIRRFENRRVRNRCSAASSAASSAATGVATEVVRHAKVPS